MGDKLWMTSKEKVNSQLQAKSQTTFCICNPCKNFKYGGKKEVILGNNSSYRQNFLEEITATFRLRESRDSAADGSVPQSCIPGLSDPSNILKFKSEQTFREELRTSGLKIFN